MHPTDATTAEDELAEITPEAHETAARLGALLRHLFIYDRGQHLRAIEESGLTLTQCKALLRLGGPGLEPKPSQVSELGEALGVSAPSISRAVDGLVREGLASRVEDPEDRRVRRVEITAKGTRVVDELTARRMAGLESFAADLSAAQRRKLDAAIEALMDREVIAKAYEQLREVNSA